MAEHIYAKNKKAFFDYEIIEAYEAGIKLKGYEVKSVKKGLADLHGSFAIIRGREAYLTNVSIPPYQKANIPESYDEQRPRQLLLHKKQIQELEERLKQGGLTLIPLKLYNKKGLIKIELGIARGKRKYDKREAIKKREDERKIRRSLKR
ncbi:MAG: SsrA-binding protein SmpB [Candidatus Spechtbacteria bacterium]|nr:SsrA-binding protein SmpB [Candidatus Spechtbacteria bacterium]